MDESIYLQAALRGRKLCPHQVAGTEDRLQEARGREVCHGVWYGVENKMDLLDGVTDRQDVHEGLLRTQKATENGQLLSGRQEMGEDVVVRSSGE